MVDPNPNTNPNPNPDTNPNTNQQPGQALLKKQKQPKRRHLASYRDKEAGKYAESIIVGGKSKYASVDLADREVRLIDHIDYPGGRFYPPTPDDFDNLNTTYIFKNEAEFDDTLEKAKYETIETLYQRVLTQWKRYSCAGKYENELCAAWTIYTYFEDVFGIVFYLFFIGTPDSGKTNKLRIVNKLGYRNLMSSAMTAANVFRHLGCYQECQGTICEDEADRMDEDVEKMKIYKNGYTKGVRVRRNDKEGGSSKYSGNWYCTFGSKAFGSENSVDSLGFKSRAVEIKCIADIPDWDITDVINETGDDELETLHKELTDVRKLLFCYKLIHCHQKYPNIELNIYNREAQIFKPLLRLFRGTETQNKLFKIMSHFVGQRRAENNQNEISLVYQICNGLVDEQAREEKDNTKNLITIASAQIYEAYIQSTDAERVGKSTCESAEFGRRAEQTIIKMVKDNFKALPPKHTGTRRELVFSRRVMNRLSKKYQLDNIEIKEITREQKQELRRQWREANRVFRDEGEEEQDDDNSSRTKVESPETPETEFSGKQSDVKGQNEHEKPRSEGQNNNDISSKTPSQPSQPSQTSEQQEDDDDDDDGGHNERVKARYDESK